MKKVLFVLVTVLALLCMTAIAENADLVAEEVTGKVDLWTHEFTVVDQSGLEEKVPLRVTFEPEAPVMLTRLPVSEEMADQVCTVIVQRDGVGDVMIALSPADRGLHYNLNDYTDEMLQEYIQSVAEANYADSAYTAEVLVSEGGNTFVRVGDGTTEILSTIYEDFTMEFLLYHIEEDADGNVKTFELTDEDRAFAIEMFQSVWTDDVVMPVTDLEITLNVNKQLVDEALGNDFDDMIDTVNASTLVIHTQDDLLSIVLKSDSADDLRLDFVVADEGLLIESNVLEGKAFLVPFDVIAKLNGAANAEGSAISADMLSFENTLAALENAVAFDMKEDGTVSIAISGENARAVVNAVSEDIKASGLLGDGLSEETGEEAGDLDPALFVDMVFESIYEMLPEDNLITIDMKVSDDGSMTFTGEVHYNQVGYTYNEEIEDFVTETEAVVVVFEASAVTNDEGTFQITAGMVTQNGETELPATYFELNIPENGEISAELSFGTVGADGMKKDYGFSFHSNIVDEYEGDNDINMAKYDLSFDIPNEAGELEPMATLSFVSNGTEEDSFNSLYLNISGYEDPAFILRLRSVFGENLTVETPEEIVRVSDVNEETLEELITALAVYFGGDTSAAE